MSETIIQIVRRHLEDGGYTGLALPDGECGCELADLHPCGENFSACRPGHKHMDPRPEYTGNWAIWLRKEAPTIDEWERTC